MLTRGVNLYYFIVWLVIFILVEALLFFIYIQSTGFKVTTYDVKVDKDIKKDIRLCLLTDLHDTDTGHDNEELLKAIDDAKPDFVVLAGDMITSYMQPKYDATKTYSFLQRLAARHKVYYSLGNHEHRYLHNEKKFPGRFKQLTDFCKDNNIILLNNEKVLDVDTDCNIYGLTIPIEYYKRVVTKKLSDDFIESELGKIEDEKINILLAHNPDQFDKYAAWGADVVCSGHVHGGIVSLPFLGGVLSPQLKLFPKYDAGMFDKDKSVMVLSRGLGWHSVPIRIFNKAELVVINVKGNKE